jgi:putative membrane protein
MIQYNPKDWFTFIFRFHKADTFRQLAPLMFFIGLYCWLVGLLEINLLHLGADSSLKNISILHTLLGLALSMLLVFRTNTAYERWWEGRKLWGSLVNSSRNLALKLNAILEKEEDKKFFKLMIPNFAFLLKNSLRSVFIKDEFQDTADFKVTHLSEQKHLPLQAANAMFQRLHQLNKKGEITQEQMLYMNAELQSFADVLGACERIKKTPIPFSYSVFIKKFIFFYVMTLPFGYVISLHWLIIPVVTFIFYALASLELIAEEIENPFGTDSNDLPIDDICATIKKSVDDILA